MKTEYQTPEIEVLTLYAEDVITASSGLTGGDGTDPGSGAVDWGDLWN